METKEQYRLIKDASIKMAGLSQEIKNDALRSIIANLTEEKERIFLANKKDIERSEKEGLASPIIKRLKFDESKLNDVIDGINSLIAIADPVGITQQSTLLDDGLSLYRVSSPIGVIGVIFESRPDALIQISTLCLKSGNAAILKGGSEARETNRVLADIVQQSTSALPDNWMVLAETRADVNEMLTMDQYIDLLIPRGSNEFVRYIMDNTKIPVMGHADGICHCYVDAEADLDMALAVVLDSKTQYVAVCNATETLLVHEKAAGQFLPAIYSALSKKDVTIFGCDKTTQIIDVLPATEKDWSTEYLDYIISIKVVSDMDEAIHHINVYGSGHTDSIITKNRDHAQYFMKYVDSGNVFWNCSTRFSDGYRYGFGAEVGISTSKLHARGPVGLDGLVIYKYKVIGNGHIVEDYSNKKKTFKHLHTNEDCPL